MAQKRKSRRSRSSAKPRSMPPRDENGQFIKKSDPRARDKQGPDAKPIEHIVTQTIEVPINRTNPDGAAGSMPLAMALEDVTAPTETVVVAGVVREDPKTGAKQKVGPKKQSAKYAALVARVNERAERIKDGGAPAREDDDDFYPGKRRPNPYR